MDLAARRPHISAGLALASAAVIAAGPMTQHLPKFDVAQHLPTVSVTDINLTDAASGMVDLFAGVENELASLASGASAAAVPAAALTDFVNPAALPLPLATWVNTFQAAGTNLQTLINTWSKIPFPVAQQVAANWVNYADLYVKSFQTAGTAAINYFTGNASFQFQGTLQKALSQLMSGQIQKGILSLYSAVWANPVPQIASPLENILGIPIYITQNFANATNNLLNAGNLGSALTLAVLGITQNLPKTVVQALGFSLQAVNDSWGAGNTLGALTNLVNTPGAVVNGFLNGTYSTVTGVGLLNPLGVLGTLVDTIPRNLAKAIVAPGSVNIATGGSLSGAFQGLANQLVNGWPSLSPVIGDISAGLTQLLRNIPSVLANLPSILGNIATNVGTVLIRLLGLL